MHADWESCVVPREIYEELAVPDLAPIEDDVPVVDEARVAAPDLAPIEDDVPVVDEA
jgi:hypothetical protein